MKAVRRRYEGLAAIENRQQLLVIAAIGVIALWAADRLVFTPLTSLWKSRSATITELRKQVAEGTSLLGRETVIRNRWEDMKKNTLPGNPSLAEQQMLKAFDNWSRQSRVSITSIMPQWKHDSDNYMTLQCRVDAAGDLEMLSQFIYDVEKDPMALKVESVELTSRDNNGQSMTLGMQISGLVLTTQTK
jgi:Tfp pilus assembly protein PilO